MYGEATWKYQEGNKQFTTEAIVIYFHENILGEPILQHAEMYRIKQLFAKAKRGMEITGTTVEQMKTMMLQLLEAKDFENVLELLKNLNFLSHTTDYKLLASVA